jgi:hypothetical protein
MRDAMLPVECLDAVSLLLINPLLEGREADSQL